MSGIHENRHTCPPNIAQSKILVFWGQSLMIRKLQRKTSLWPRRLKILFFCKRWALRFERAKHTGCWSNVLETGWKLLTWISFINQPWVLVKSLLFSDQKAFTENLCGLLRCPQGIFYPKGHWAEVFIKDTRQPLKRKKKLGLGAVEDRKRFKRILDL